MKNASFSQLFSGDLLTFDPEVYIWRNDLIKFNRGDIFYLIFSVIINHKRLNDVNLIIEFFFVTKRGIQSITFYGNDSYAPLFKKI